MKKLVTALLMLVLLSLAFAALADNVRTSGLYTYEIKGNGTITITNFDWNKNSGDIYIPNMIDGYTVTAIGDKAFSVSKYDKNASKVIIVLPNTVTTIGEKAFMNASISTISIPSDTKLIGSGAFANCPISQFSVAPDNKTFATIDGVLYNKSTKTLISFPANKDTSDEIVIPEGILAIGDYAFYFDKDYGQKGRDVSYIKWPSTLKAIGDYAFYGRYFSKEYFESTLPAPHIRNYTLIPPTIDSIGNYAFANCTYSLPKESNYDKYTIAFGNAQDIGIGCFQNAYIFNDDCQSQYTISLGERLSNIPDFAFEGIDVHKKGIGAADILVQLPKSILHIGKSAFENCLPVKGLSSTRISSIGENAFANTGVFQGDLSIPGSLKTISKGAFSGSKGAWKYISLQEGVEVIEENAFSGQLQLTDIQLSSTLKEIGKNAFSGCNKLTSITIPTKVNVIGNNAFERTTITLFVEENSYSSLWAQENGYSYKYVGQNDEDLSWLTDTSGTSKTIEDTSWLNN